MPYELHIERPEPIELAEWKAALAATAGVRLCASDAWVTENPSTGEVVRIAKRDGDAEVYFPEDDTWRPVLGWRGRSASVTASSTRRAPNDRVWPVLEALAARLGAVIRGEEGESYDPVTGEPSDSAS